MDREILFRGKRLDNREWVKGAHMKHIKRNPCPFGDLAKPEDIAHLIIFNGFADWNMPAPINCVQVDPATVGQYTGLTNKDGVKIFEGDILASRYDEDHPEDVTIEVVAWAYNGWCVKVPGGDMCPMDDSSELPYAEVIGNIYDNPELLEPAP